jgi:CHASE2 domain-containing sensor protein
MWRMGARRHRRRDMMTSQQSTAASGEQATGTKDTTYTLVSVLYHALQGAETSETYLQDAAETGDQELIQFLREAQAWQRYLASQAQALLTQRLGHGDGRVWNPETKIWNLMLMA